jgi:hypothetical protein
MSAKPHRAAAEVPAHRLARAVYISVTHLRNAGRHLEVMQSIMSRVPTSLNGHALAGLVNAPQN